ncbi:hypothetical protein EDB86DRAFT_3109076 [Lactarius hatsudake]|nr:hypothetical protein EDB86DRAFT_3109076 [Lactarius hatsudake]
MPTRALPNRPGCNVHPAAAQKALEEKLHDVRMAKERLVQLNVTEEDKEDDLHLLHLQRLSTAIHKQRHIDVESDDEHFDLREADNGSNPNDSSSESDKATKTKTKSWNKRVKGAARQELLTRTEDLRGAKHTEETRRQQKSMHDIGRFTAQDLRCKKYANSGLRLQAPSLVPPNAALTPTLLQQPDVTDPLELGGLSDSDLEETCPVIAEIQSLVSDKPPRLVKIRTKADVHPGKLQATRKPPCHKSKAVKAIVKKDSKRFTEAQPDTHPDIACQCLDDSRWTRIFLLTLSHTLYISDHPFTDWTQESSALVETVQVAFELSFTNISYTLSAQDGIVKAAYDRMKTRRSKIASDVLMLVKTFFERAEFKDQPEKIKDYVHWALKAGGPAYYENPYKEARCHRHFCHVTAVVALAAVVSRLRVITAAASPSPSAITVVLHVTVATTLRVTVTIALHFTATVALRNIVIIDLVAVVVGVVAADCTLCGVALWCLLRAVGGGSGGGLFILPVAKTYLGFASRSVLHPTLGPKSPPRGLYVMILTAVERAMRAYLTGRFNAPGDFNHQTSWNAMKDFDRILDRPHKTWGLVPRYCGVFGLGQASRGSAISVSRSHDVAATRVPIPSIPSLPYRSLARSIHPSTLFPPSSLILIQSFLATTQTDDDDDADDPQDGL